MASGGPDVASAAGRGLGRPGRVGFRGLGGRGRGSGSLGGGDARLAGDDAVGPGQDEAATVIPTVPGPRQDTRFAVAPEQLADGATVEVDHADPQLGRRLQLDRHPDAGPVASARQERARHSELRPVAAGRLAGDGHAVPEHEQHAEGRRREDPALASLSCPHADKHASPAGGATGASPQESCRCQPTGELPVPAHRRAAGASPDCEPDSAATVRGPLASMREAGWPYRRECTLLSSMSHGAT